MGFLGGLSNYITPATQAASDFEGAGIKADELVRQRAIQDLMMKRQAQMDAIKAAVDQSTIGKNTSETALNTKKVGQVQPGDPGYASYNANVEYQKGLTMLPVEKQIMVARGQIDLSNALREIASRGNVEAGLQASRIDAEAAQGNLNRAASAANTQATVAGGVARVKQTQAGSLTGRLLGVPGGTGDNPTPSQQQKDWDQAAAHARSLGQDPADVLPPRPE